MLPDFLIIGVQKGATTWLANSLSQHPDVFIAEQKEVHFFNAHFEKGLKWYKQQFSDWAGQKAVGEATPGYIYFPSCPSRIQAALGDNIKLIVSLRHPVDRAYSAYWMFLSRGLIPAEADFRTLFDQDDHGLQNRGYYFAQLSHYLEHFSRENFLVLIYEETKKNNQKTLRTCFDFLGVDPEFVLPEEPNIKTNQAIAMSKFHYPIWSLRRFMKKTLSRKMERPLASLGRHIFDRLPKQKRYAPPDDQLRQELLTTFIPDIQQLEDLLDRDLSIWYESQQVKTPDMVESPGI